MLTSPAEMCKVIKPELSRVLPLDKMGSTWSPKEICVPDAWSRTYPSGHRARITKSFERTYSLEVFTASGDRLLDFALLLPSLELAQETADYVVNAQGEPWIATTADEASESTRPPTIRRARRSH